jgi:ATP-binding cassette subfamily C protein
MIKAILKRFMAFKTHFFLVSILLLFIYICQLLIPYVFSNFIDNITQYTTVEIDYTPVLIISILTIILIGSSYVHHILTEVLNIKAGYVFLEDVDNKLEHTPIRKIEKHSPAYLNNRIFNDILTTLGFVINHFIVAIIMVISTIFLFVLIIQINPFLVFIPLIALLINISGILLLNKEYYKRGYQYREDNNQYVSDNNDLITQIKETKVHSWYDISGKRVKKSYKTLLKTGIRLNKVLALLNNIGTFSKNITLILTMFIGGYFIVNNIISIGEFILITYYTNMCLNYSDYFLKLGQQYQHAKVSYHRLEEFFKVEDEHNGTTVIESIKTVKLEEVTYSYPESPILINKLDFTFEKGRIYCLKGKNGEGKSTLIDIILGLDYSFEGFIKYNNIDIQNLDMINIRKNYISVVLQEPRVQRLPVLNNLTRGLENYSEDILEGYINLFDLKKILNNPDSTSLSGGEKQKISIVRALLKNPSIMIMDEPISALDNASIKKLKNVLSKLKDSMIVILISHNEDLFDIVDEIVELPKVHIGEKHGK